MLPPTGVSRASLAPYYANIFFIQFPYANSQHYSPFNFSLIDAECSAESRWFLFDLQPYTSLCETLQETICNAFRKCYAYFYYYYGPSENTEPYIK